MIAALVAIWQFLVAIGPVIAAIGTTIVEIAAALWELTKIITLVTAIWALVELLFDPKGRERLGIFLGNLTSGAIRIAGPVLIELKPLIPGVVTAFVEVANEIGPSLRQAVEPSINGFAQTNFNSVVNNLTALGQSTPDNAVAHAAAAISEAFGFGMSSAAVTAAFESMFPEKLNVLNGVGPMLAQLAGFQEVTAAVRQPLYQAAFGQGARYKFNETFRPYLPDLNIAGNWHARRLITTAQYNMIFVASGLKTDWEAAAQEAAFRPLPPFLLARAAEAGYIPQGALTAALQFAGFRDSDISELEQAYALLALQPYEQQFLSAAVRSAELGTITPAELDSDMDVAHLNPAQKNLVQLTVATRKLEQLAELYRKSISEAYQYGNVTDANYVSSLNAIGIADADARAHYAIDSIKKHGKDMLAAQRAEARLEAERTRAEANAAIELFRNRQIDGAQLEVQLIAAGLDPTVATYSALLQSQRRDGIKVFVYGEYLPRDLAIKLRAEVSAVEGQYKKGLITFVEADTELQVLGIQPPLREALLSYWSTAIVKAAGGPVLKPL